MGGIAVAALVAHLLLGACQDYADQCQYLGTCPLPPDAGDGGDAAMDAASGAMPQGAPPASLNCNGQCVPLGPSQWSDPFLVSIGTNPLACVHPAPVPSFSGIAPPTSFTCEACTCGAPEGTCALPATATESAATCTDGGTGTTLDLPSPWNGSCTAANASAVAVQAVTVPPLGLTESGCMPSTGGLAGGTPSATLAQGCTGTPHGECAGDSDTCIPAPAGSWLVCITPYDAEMACRKDSLYNELYTFWFNATDGRTCSPCTCGPPDGSACSAVFTGYADGACSEEVASILASSSAAVCAAAAPLGSIAATVPMYTPGACPASGGQVVGSVSLGTPEILCCLPSPPSTP
jgi:hypothetical protein